MFLWLLASRHWTEPKPINAFVIEHRADIVFFDTGQDRASVTEPDYFQHPVQTFTPDGSDGEGIGPVEPDRGALRGDDDGSTVWLAETGT